MDTTLFDLEYLFSGSLIGMAKLVCSVLRLMSVDIATNCLPTSEQAPTSISAPVD
jgi:hypothetical protein